MTKPVIEQEFPNSEVKSAYLKEKKPLVVFVTAQIGIDEKIVVWKGKSQRFFTEKKASSAVSEIQARVKMLRRELA